ncbi:MAG: carbohydrate ABC transporter permease [Candidatus Hydrogenedentes bacterium]|nr:carbohydrate ABC transporter permease [Candidatus Hydrogenedentota bacterium]
MAAYRQDHVSAMGRVGAFAILLLYTAISLLSLYLMLSSSLTRLGSSFSLSDLDWIPRDWAWDNFTGFFDLTHDSAWTWLRNSLLVALVPTCCNLIFSAMAGYALAKIDFPGRLFFFWLIIAVMAVPSFVTLIPLYQMMFSFGWFDTFFALIVPRMAGLGGVFLFKQFMSTLPRELMQAARVDGASEWTIFWRIVMPMARPVLAVMFLLDFVGAWNDYFWPYLVTNSKDMMTLQVGLISLIGVDQGFVFPVDYGIIMAGAVMVSLPVIILFVALQRFFIQGLTIGAVKG